MKSIAKTTMLIALLLPGMTMAEPPVYGGGWKEFKGLLMPGVELTEGFRPSIYFPLIDVMSNATERMRDYHDHPTVRPATGGPCNGPDDAFGKPLPFESGQLINRELADYYCK